MILSCGHEVDSFDKSENLLSKSADRKGQKAVSYGTYCKKCAVQYRKEKIIFDTWEEAETWLFGEGKQNAD